MPRIVSEKPILFSTPMVKAILEGRKTMTRRVVKLQTGKEYHVRDYEQSSAPYGRYQVLADGYDSDAKECKCPYGQVGSHLWVRETWTRDTGLAGNKVHYKADGEAYSWKPSIFMPRWASRITLEITNIRVERLQEITETDAKAEGCSSERDTVAHAMSCEFPCKVENHSARGWFKYLWDSINGKTHSWESNPWVWCLSFRRINNA